MKNLKGVKVGDRVWSPRYGWGTIDKIEEQGTYCLYFVADRGQWAWYIIDGRERVGADKPSLFFSIPEFYKNDEYPARPRWRAEYGGIYYYVASTGIIDDALDGREVLSNARFEIGNYFQTEEEAKESKFYKVFHEDK